MGASVGAAARSGGAVLALAAGCPLGVALQLQQASLCSTGQAAALTAAGLGLAAAAWLGRKRWPRRGALLWLLLAAVAAAAAGFGSTTLRAAARLADALAPALEGVDLVATGVVAELPRIGAGGTRFVFEVESATLNGAAAVLPPRLALGWYRQAEDDALLGGAGPDLRAGQRWRLPLRLRAPHGTLNPHGFDLELWLFEQGIAAVGTVRPRIDALPLRLADSAAHPVERLRQSVRDAILRWVADPAAAGVLAALAIGDQAAIDRPGWELFRVTGVAHLMSISGLHVTMFAWLAGLACAALWRRHPRAPLLWPVPHVARWGGLAAAAGYALLAGWGVPAQRTVWMLAIVALLRTAGVRWPLHAVLGAAGLAVVALDPWAMLQPGFWLSFVAVALLAAAEPVAPPPAMPGGWRARLWQAVRGGLRTQAVATVGLAPLTLVFFQQLSLVGFAANLIAIPLVTLVITPLALLGVLLPPLWPLDGWIVSGLVAFLQQLAALPLATWAAAAAPPWAVACGLVAGALAVLPLPWRLRACAVPLLLPLLAPPLDRPEPGRIEVVAADIGQGTSVLVRTHGHLLLFDTGPQTSGESDAGSRELVPLLRSRGETRIDLLVLSHRDSDHVGGAASVLAALPVAAMSSSLGPDHPLRLRPRAPPHRRCDAGQGWDWDGVRFEFLHPLAADHDAPGLKPNALSCVLRVEAANASLLLSGDIEAGQEAALLGRAAEALRSDVLIVPHHGSRTSSTPAFIGAVQPRWAVVQAAYRSRYGHPAPEVVARYLERGATLVRSDTCGAWTLAADAQARCERDSARRYWHHPGEPAP